MSETGTNFQTTVTEANIDAADWYRVTVSPGDQDNIELLWQVFSGADLIKGTAVGDKLNSYAGDDRLLGRGGNDRLWGDKGRDLVNGGGGADKIDGGKGADVLIGGRGEDTFIFRGKKAGHDKIKDFVEGKDLIKIKVGTVDSFSDLTVTYNGDDARISYESTVIKVLDVGANALEANDFMF